MTTLKELEDKIRQAITELKEEYEAFEDGSIDRDMITQIMLNHVLAYIDRKNLYLSKCNRGNLNIMVDSDYELVGDFWNLKSPYLKDQSEELINFLNELK